MGSKTKHVKTRRALRKAKGGKKRKNSAANKGSTVANLPLDKPNANEKAKAKKS